MIGTPCVICRGHVRADLGHGFTCNGCGGVTCGNCFSAINVPHMAAGHQVGIVFCRTCRLESERLGHTARMQSFAKHYTSVVHTTMVDFREQRAKPVEQRQTTEEVFGDAQAREVALLIEREADDFEKVKSVLDAAAYLRDMHDADADTHWQATQSLKDAVDVLRRSRERD